MNIHTIMLNVFNITLTYMLILFNNKLYIIETELQFSAYIVVILLCVLTLIVSISVTASIVYGLTALSILLELSYKYSNGVYTMLHTP